MELQRQSDQKRVLDFVRECCAIRDPEPIENFFGRLVGALSRMVPCLHVTYNEVNPATMEFSNIGSTPESSGAKVEKLLEMYLREHPWLIRYMGTGDGRAGRVSDCLSRRQFQDTGLYGGFYRQYDIEDDLCLIASADTPQPAAIVWHRDRRFTDRELSMAHLVQPFIIQAIQNARMMSRLHSQAKMLERGLESARAGVIDCDAEGRVRLITALARQYLTEYFGETKGLDRQLPQELLGWMRRQYALLHQDDLGQARPPFAVQKGGNRLTVQMQSSDGVNLLVLEETASGRKMAANAEHSLSLREREVLAWAAQGKTNSSIAAILGMSSQTAKKHMEHILHKMGVENRTAAVALALQSLSRDK
jgi:DNA-binding CsgD family transcriptional regulator